MRSIHSAVVALIARAALSGRPRSSEVELLHDPRPSVVVVTHRVAFHVI
jgi:hypothetical protein